MKHNSSRLFLFSALAATFATPTLSQETDYGILYPKAEESREAGIASYRLHGTDETSRIEVWGADQQPLANCDIAWEKAETTATCSFADGGQWRWTWSEELQEGSLVDLLNGETVTFRVSLPQPPPLPLDPQEPGEFLPELQPRWVFEGKTPEQIEADWGTEFELVPMMVYEVMLSIGQTSVIRGSEPTSPTTSIINRCAENETRSCAGTSDAFGTAFSFFGRANCCAKATLAANRQCLLLSASGCCSYGACASNCLLSVCTCSKPGSTWRCVLCT